MPALDQAERERLRSLLNRHISTFDQNLKSLELQTDLHPELYSRLIEEVGEAAGETENTDEKRIACMAFIGWQAMQIEWLRRQTEDE